MESNTPANSLPMSFDKRLFSTFFDISHDTENHGLRFLVAPSPRLALSTGSKNFRSPPVVSFVALSCTRVDIYSVFYETICGLHGKAVGCHAESLLVYAALQRSRAVDVHCHDPIRPNSHHHIMPLSCKGGKVLFFLFVHGAYSFHSVGLKEMSTGSST